MPDFDTVFFYAFAFMTLAGALLTITRRNAVHSALWLIVSLLGVAGLYLLQQAEFLFAVQIILYIGGIMLLFLFVIMLVNLDEAARQRQFNRQWWLVIACLICITAELIYFFRGGMSDLPWTSPRPAAAVVGNTEQIGDVLFSEYLLPFEAVSLLLLVAIVGSVFMTKRRAS